MEQNEMITLPFDIRLAKAIKAGIIQGRIHSKEGNYTARIICFDKVKHNYSNDTEELQIVTLFHNENPREDMLFLHNRNGEVYDAYSWERAYDLVIEVKKGERTFIENFICPAKREK